MKIKPKDFVGGLQKMQALVYQMSPLIYSIVLNP